MSTLAVQSFRHLSRLARVYLCFALIGVLVGLIYTVASGLLPGLGQASEVDSSVDLITVYVLLISTLIANAAQLLILFLATLSEKKRRSTLGDHAGVLLNKSESVRESARIVK